MGSDFAMKRFGLAIKLFFSLVSVARPIPVSDVTQPIGSCSGAAGDGLADDTIAINCHANYMSATYGGGIVLAPCGNYLTSGLGVIVPAGVWLIGNGTCSHLLTNTDSVVVSFSISGGTCPTGNHYGGMEKIKVTGYTNPAATKAATSVGANCNVTLRDNVSWYGAHGLWNDGVDTHVEGGFYWGYTAALSSGGANWYVRVKFDQPGSTGSVYGYQQRANISGLPTPENHFVHVDFTGSYSGGHVSLADTGNSSITTIEGSVIGGPIVINHSRALMLSSTEIGGNIYVGNGNLLASNNYAVFRISVSGPGSKSCSNNINFVGC
jgi:hypothetical protein